MDLTSDSSSNNSEENLNKLKINENKIFIQNYIDNPKIILTDFGLIMKKNNSVRTVQTRYYRSPEIIFGLNYNEKIDLWSFGCTLYELITGVILINVEKTEYNLKYDKDLINIKLLIEKIENVGFSNILKMANGSRRRDYIFNEDNTLKFFKEINYNNWKNIFEEDETLKELNEIIILIDGLLKINPENRTMQ